MNRESTNKKRKRHSIVRNAAETTPNEGKSSERGVGVGSSVYTSGGGSASGMQEKNMLKYNTNQIIQEIRRMTVTPIQRKIMEQKIATLKSERVTRLRGIGSSGGRMVGGMSELAKKREEGHNMEITPLGEKGAAKGFLETAKAIDMRRFLTGSPGACEYIGTPVISAVDVESGRLTSSTGKKNKHKHKGGDIKLDKKSIENYSVHLTQNSGKKPVPTTPGISKRVIVKNSKKNALVEQLLRIAENRKENRSNRWAIEYARLGYLVGKGAEERMKYAEILVDNGEYMLAEDIIFGNQEEEEEQHSIPMLKLGVVVLHRMGDIERMGMLKERIQRIEEKRNKHEIKNKGYLFTPTQSDRHMDSTKDAYEHINGSDTNIPNTGIDDTCDKNDRWDICGETEKRAGEGFDWYIAGESIRVSNSIEGWEGLIGRQKKKVTSQDIRAIVKMCWETAIKCDARTLEAWIGLRKHKMVDIQEEKRLVVEVADWSGSCGGDSMAARFFKNYVLATSERDNSGSDELLLEKARKELVGEHMGIVNDSRFAILEAQRCFEAEKYVESLKWAYLSSTLVSGGTVGGNRHSRGQSLPQRVENESEWVVVASLAAQNDLERLFAEATMLADYFGVSKLSREQITTGESGRDSVYLRYEKEMRGLAEILDETGRTRERVLTMFQRKYNNMADARSFGGGKLGRQHVGSGGYGANVRRRFGEYVGYGCSLGVEPRSRVMGKELKLPVCWYAIGSYYLGLAIKQMRSYGAGNNGGDQNDKRYSTRLDEGGNVEISIKKARKYLTEAWDGNSSNSQRNGIIVPRTGAGVLILPGWRLSDDSKNIKNDGFGRKQWWSEWFCLLCGASGVSKSL
ncbi:hypothetical protein AX774_g4355 [Zancudomyces culisetae]|uniref:Uncharacterized protein n=1 Tax=Zancudomyces culisetae TaxID=1213189 RepID=A0A1R1PMK2_ZANCU|nr:hypothetical protein AX774_g4355 [Zancudomyces culisetae]|eukprot:OMH82177.1 hypothetical protein AX774_g4355 [Zancudomyces culisetae]